MLSACRNNINTGCIDACMSKDIGELCYVLFDPVKGSRKQMPEIVRKDLALRYVCLLTQCLHFPPDAISAYGLAPSCDKDGSPSDSLLFCITKQFFS